MVKPPTSGRSKQVLDGVHGGAAFAYSEAIDDLLLFNDVMILLDNVNADESIDYLIQVKANMNDTDATWRTVKNQATLAKATSIVITHDDIGDLDACWDAVRIGYIQTDGSNKGTLNAWINRK